MKKSRRGLAYFFIGNFAKRWIITTLCVCLMILLSTCFCGCDVDTTKKLNLSGGGEGVSSQAAGRTISLSELESKEVYVLCLNSGKVMCHQQSNKRIYPASLTKMMTALVALEHVNSLDEEVIVPEEIFTNLYLEHASRAGFEPGEIASVRDLLYGVILPSGAECCLALAKHIGGSEQGFVTMMNEKARELGMERTHFTNTTGLQEENHYTTVADLAKLLQAALKNGHFRKIFTTRSHTTLASDKHPKGFTFKSTMFEKLTNVSVRRGSILGGKTGYTKEAGLCLASLAQIDEKEYICITTGADGDHNTKPYHIEDTIQIYNQLAR